MSNSPSPEAARQVDRLALHVGLMAVLLQRGAPLSLVQAQCVSLRTMLAEFLLLDEPAATFVHVDRLLPPEVANALAEDFDVPDTPEGL